MATREDSDPPVFSGKSPRGREERPTLEGAFQDAMTNALAAGYSTIELLQIEADGSNPINEYRILVMGR
jgi:hypothetical protein